MPVSSLDAIGIGYCTVDLFFRVPDAPDFGKRVRASAYLRQPGGMAATAIVTLARLGASVGFVGKIGDDEEGAYIRDDFVREGVDVSGLIEVAGTLSRVALVIVNNQTGERGFSARRDTCPPLEAHEVDRHAIASAKVLLVDDATDITVQAALWAREAGTKVVLDGTWYRGRIEDLLALVDFPVVSAEFLKTWKPHLSPELAVQELRDLTGGVAVVTLGDLGCLAATQSGVFRYSAFDVNVVDTTGAGDAYHGGFVYGLLHEWSVHECVRFASAVAALNCKALGGRTGLPHLDVVMDFMARQDAKCLPVSI